MEAIHCGDWIAARVHSEAALAEDPASPDAHHALAASCWQTGSAEMAIDHLETSARLRPDAACWNNLGVAYAGLGKWTEATGAFERSLELGPDDPTTLAHYGRALCERGQFAAALQVLQEALVSDAVPAARIDLAWALQETGDSAEAHAALLQALETFPKAARAHRLLTRACRSLKRFSESAEHARAAADLDPCGETFTELALALWSEGDLVGSLAAVERAFACGVASPDSHSCLLYLMQFDPCSSGEKLYLAHRSWAVTHAAGGSSEFCGRSADGRKLRVGYLTTDLFTSPARRSRLPLLTHADTTRFEIYHYSTQPAVPGLETQYRALPGVHRNVQPLSDAELLALIREDCIDVLVDLTGHHSYGRQRVLAARAAPVQISYSTYPGTTGLRQVDYLLTDESMTPAGSEHEYSEKVWRLPWGSLMYAPPSVEPPVSALPASVNGFVTFGLFQRESKLGDPCWDAIARSLKATPHSRLLVHNDSPGLDSQNGGSPARILSSLTTRGIAPDRVQFRGRLPMQEHLETLAQADLALDTFPYNGHATTCDCLWAGVPVVTLRGDRHAGRVGAGLLHQVGLDVFVAHSVDEYVAIASRASDIPALERLRTMLRDQSGSSPLFDTRKRTREIEQIYEEAWERWRESVSRGQQADSPRNSRFQDS